MSQDLAVAVVPGNFLVQRAESTHKQRITQTMHQDDHVNKLPEQQQLWQAIGGTVTYVRTTSICGSRRPGA